MRTGCLIIIPIVPLLLFFIIPQVSFGQQLIVNGNFNQTTFGWTAPCPTPTCTVEAIYYETSYGGTNASNHVAEIDDQSNFYQEVCILPGASYIFSMDASRRTGNGAAPNPEISHIQIDGLDATGNIVTNFVSMNYTRTNTVFALTPVANIPVITVPVNSGVVKLKIYFCDSTPGQYATLGMIIDTISLVFQTPPAVLSSNIAGSDTACKNAPQTFAISQLPDTSAAITYNWTFSPDATPSTSPLSTPSVSWGNIGSGIITCAVGNVTCNVLNLNDTIVIKPAPVPTVISPVSFCQYSIAASLASDATGDSLLWYTDPPTGPGSPNAPVPSTASPGTFNYYVSQTINGCLSDSIPITVKVIHKPTLSFNVADTQICLLGQDTFVYTGNATNSGIYNWVLPPGDPIISGSGTNTIVAAFNNTGIAQIGFSVIDSGCASDDTTLSINVIRAAAPVFNFMPDVCTSQADSIFYTDPTGNSNDKYFWTFTGAASVNGSGAGPYSVVWNSSGAYSVSLAAIEDNCPSDTTVSLVNVHPIPDIHIISPSSTDVCIGDSLQLRAGTDTVPVYAYQWMPFSDFPINDASQVYGIIDTPGYIIVRGITNYGCVNTDSIFINIHPCCEISVPNAFTPNGDGLNDVFRIIGIRPQKIIDFRVFNRFGNVVYNSTDGAGWDGTYNGTLADMATYYYTITYICADGKEYQKKGDVTLIR